MIPRRLHNTAQAVPKGRPVCFVAVQGGLFNACLRLKSAAVLLLGLVFALAGESCSPSGQQAAAGADSDTSSGYQAALQADGRYLVQLEGQTMGTTYRVRYFQPGGSKPKNFKPAVDSVLEAFNACLSTYDPASTLSRWNAAAGGSEVPFEGACGTWASRLDALCRNIHAASNGAFDPTVMPLVRYWGFFTEDPFAGGEHVDSAAVDSLMGFTGWTGMTQAVDAREQGGSFHWIKTDPRVQLDFNAVAKGLGVDVVAEYLRTLGLRNLLVEIGGEVVAYGSNASGGPWRIALEKPEAGQRSFHSVLNLRDAAMATSGNYRRFWEKDGVRYGHSLNPQTGYPEKSRLLSATVVARDCATADAWATACMVMGMEEGMKAIEAQTEVEAYFMYLDEESSQSGIASMQSTGFAALTGER